MKKICVVLGIIVLMVATGFATFKITSEIIGAKIIQEIEVDGVDEVDNGIITLKINGQYYDYEYEYTEIDRNGQIEVEKIMIDGEEIDHGLVTINNMGEKFDYYFEVED